MAMRNRLQRNGSAQPRPPSDYHEGLDQPTGGRTCGEPCGAKGSLCQTDSSPQFWVDSETRYQPATAEGKRRELLARSRQYGILIPETTFIVVENQAQWDMLDRAEIKSLKADS